MVELRTERWADSKCRKSKDLKLVSVYFNYPYLKHNPRKVNIWEGEYTRLIYTRKTYLRELVNTCSGEIISVRNVYRDKEEKVTFDLKNPNLSPLIKESYMLSPMTPAEASEEMEGLKESIGRIRTLLSNSQSIKSQLLGRSIL